jgi:tRNA-dihydrouridine synthase A
MSEQIKPLRLSVAPMMGWTDRHARYFYRQISEHTLLYTEMVTTAALLHNRQYIGKQRRLLAYHEAEHPVAIQLGGNDPKALAECALMAEDAGFDEVNLNVGCPSDRVRSGAFGACLMAAPSLVAECVAEMRQAVSIPVTVKHRIGIDEMEGYEVLSGFVATVAKAGCRTFIVHARKAWLQGLSPKDNREIPPLKYHYVHRLKREHPELDIVINGGIKNMESIQEELLHVDGVMVGREFYYNPYLLATADVDVFKDRVATVYTRKEIVNRMLAYIEYEVARGTRLHAITRHMLGLFAQCYGARLWRRYLSENTPAIDRIENNAERVSAAINCINQALMRVDEDSYSPLQLLSAN